ncbi:TonB C-terminal domain-containing protein, partial [Sphaerotilus montanus]
AVEPSASSPDPVAVALAQREAALEAQRLDVAARAEAARLEAERQETARQQAAKLEAQRQEAARQAAARAEAARLETERQEAARQAAARAEAARLEAERQEAARQAAARLEAQRQEAARQAAVRAEATRLAAERQEAERQEAVRQEAARAQAAQQEAAAKREAVLRAIGRQLDEERARRDAAANATPSPSGTLPLSLSTARRARLFGHTDSNADLVAYAQAWALKIQLNTLPDQVREITKRPHTPPTVTVAMRSDGSVESMTFVVSSGVAEIDDAIRRIVETQRPYPAFPLALAREFDVVEIRRTWYFDAAVRLH